MAAGAIVGAVVGAVVKNLAELVAKPVLKKIEQWNEFGGVVEEIKLELVMILALEEDQLFRDGDLNNVQREYMRLMSVLAQDIEDCLDRILRYAEASVSDRLKEDRNNIIHISTCSKFASYVSNLKKRLDESRNLRQKYIDVGAAASSRSPANAEKTSFMPQLEGIIGKPKDEILELLNDIEDQPEKLKVICIVGFGGSGRSTLAKAVSDEAAQRFGCGPAVWVAASNKGDIGLMKTERYVVVMLDIVGKNQWLSIRNTFPKNSRGIIIVTTTTQEIANAVCSSHGKGYVYHMRTLEVEESSEVVKSMLMHKQEAVSDFEDAIKLVVDKCHGHPLSLVSMGNFLLGKQRFTGEDFCRFWDSLGDSIKEDDSFKELEQLLMDNYRSLPDPHVRACFLYICTLPDGHPIRRNRLTRRWTAEGYAQRDADKIFEKLVDRNILRTIKSSINTKVKTCRPHGLIHGLMMHMSVKFITSVASSERRLCRHLYWKDGESDVIQSNDSQDNFHAHSLTICGSPGKEAVGDLLPKCDLLRVLDLEECDDLKSADIKDVPKLWFLKYLSLGAKIAELPEGIDKLHRLETLDARKSEKDTLLLPVEVIKLPYLTHLLGKFNLDDRDWNKSKVDPFFQETKSKLQSLAGFVINGDPGFPAWLMSHMKLNKVKIWCGSTSKDGVEFTPLWGAIQMFVNARFQGDQSLSLQLPGDSSIDILSFPSSSDSEDNTIGYLRSLKLDGALSGQTWFAWMLSGLKELCLSSTNDLSDNDLLNLPKLTILEYLKMVNINNLQSFNIRCVDFPRLRCLCLVQCRRLPIIEDGALPKLLSLWLLIDNLTDQSGIIDIEKHKLLQEVALDSRVNQSTKSSLEEAAKRHRKRPKVLFIKGDDLNGTISVEESIATDRSTTTRGEASGGTDGAGAPPTAGSTMASPRTPALRSGRKKWWKWRGKRGSGGRRRSSSPP